MNDLNDLNTRDPNSKWHKSIAKAGRANLLNKLTDADYIQLRTILEDGGTVFVVLLFPILGNLVEVTLEDFGEAKKVAYFTELHEADRALWKTANPKSKRPHYMKRNIVCLTCRTTATEIDCRICGTKTVITHYQIPPKRAVKKWASLKTMERSTRWD